MTPTQALEMVHKLAVGTYSPEELEALQEYLYAAPRKELDVFFEAYYEAVRALPPSGPVNPAFQQRLYNLRPREGDSPGETRSVRGRWLIAAAAVLVIGILLFRQPHHSIPPPLAAAPSIHPGGNKAILTLSNGEQIVLDSVHQGALSNQGGAKVVKIAPGQLAYQPIPGAPVYNTVSTPRGGSYEVALPDGSRVWLNAASSLRFPTAFTGPDRSVDVTGEAYFEVTPNGHAPFVVRAGGLTVDVLGTEFDINTYPDEAAARTTLLSGAVKVNGTLLKPGEQAVLTHGDLSVRADADLEEAVAWRNGNFLFRNADIPTIMRQVSRWYDVDVEYEGGTPAGHFTGKVSRDIGIAGVLRILSLSQIRYRIEGKTIIIE